MSVIEGNSSGLAQHPKHYGAKLEAGMKVPKDTRLLRDVKLHEVPKWFGARNWSPLGMWFAFKRYRHACYSKYIYVRRTPGVFFAQSAVAISILMYITDYGDLKSHANRKYH